MGAEDQGTDEEIFGEGCRKDIGDILGVLNDERFDAFWSALRTECLKIQRGIETTPNSFKKYAPFDATLTQRVQWLKANVLNPIKKLEAAIDFTNHPHFNHWETYGKIEAPDTPILLAEISILKRKATEMCGWLEGERTGKHWGKLSHNDEIRHYIVFTALEEIREHYPEMKLSRGNWHKGVGAMTGAIPDYIRRVFLETTGQHEQLDGQIQFATSDLRKSHKITD
ncbi:MAG: hypothetical protein QM488_12605 [Rhizobiaceae bacterium]